MHQRLSSKEEDVAALGDSRARQFFVAHILPPAAAEVVRRKAGSVVASRRDTSNHDPSDDIRVEGDRGE